MAGCVQPYAGEFVITELNGAVVTSVMTNQEGQATVELPPGKYILGVRTENVYPLAAPVKINILPDRYVHISLSLDSGLQGQLHKQVTTVANNPFCFICPCCPSTGAFCSPYSLRVKLRNTVVTLGRELLRDWMT